MGCTNDVKENAKETSSVGIKTTALNIVRNSFFCKLNAANIVKYGLDINNIMTEQEMLNYFTKINIPSNEHKLIIRISVL